MFVRFAKSDARVTVSRYGNRRTALWIIDAVSGDFICAATINFPGIEHFVGPGELLILNDGAEAGALQALQEKDLVRNTGRTLNTPTGRTACICTAGESLVYPDGF